MSRVGCTRCGLPHGLLTCGESLTCGEIGEGFIHVHHLKEISSIGEEYKIGPIEDLRRVCPNCHAMLHRRTPALSIEELKARLK